MAGHWDNGHQTRSTASAWPVRLLPWASISPGRSGVSSALWRKRKVLIPGNSKTLHSPQSMPFDLWGSQAVVRDGLTMDT